jgi:hypothetical protein
MRPTGILLTFLIPTGRQRLEAGTLAENPLDQMGSVDFCSSRNRTELQLPGTALRMPLPSFIGFCHSKVSLETIWPLKCLARGGELEADLKGGKK